MPQTGYLGSGGHLHTTIWVCKYRGTRGEPDGGVKSGYLGSSVIAYNRDRNRGFIGDSWVIQALGPPIQARIRPTGRPWPKSLSCKRASKISQVYSWIPRPKVWWGIPPCLQIHDFQNYLTYLYFGQLLHLEADRGHWGRGHRGQNGPPSV